MEEYKKLSELPQAVNPQRCEAYGVENGKSVRVPLAFVQQKDFDTFISDLEEFAQSTEEIHNFLGERLAEVRNAVYNEVSWSESFNLNYYKKQGIYYITGERLLSEYDNLPIANASPGHTISGQLTVLDASLSDTEMCVTQYLKLTNRTGSEGKEYIRTYNRFKDGREEWSLWRELKGIMNLNQTDNDDLKSYTENGLYEGAIYNGSYDMQNPPSVIAKFLADIPTVDGAREIPSGSLFSMQTLNNYAVVKKAEQMGLRTPASITQVAKVLLINGDYVEVQRTAYNGVWGNWTKINK